MYSVLSEQTKELFLKQREILTWGSYGKNGGEPIRDIPIKDLSDLHIDKQRYQNYHLFLQNAYLPLEVQK
jgi:hypothetical protein